MPAFIFNGNFIFRAVVSSFNVYSMPTLSQQPFLQCEKMKGGSIINDVTQFEAFPITLVCSFCIISKLIDVDQFKMNLLT
jgi:hypothetical protein